MADNEVDIVIRTRAELQGAKQLREELGQQIGKAKAAGESFEGLSEKLHKVEHSIRHAAPELGAFTKILTSFGAAGVAGGLAAIGAAFIEIGKAVQEAKSTLFSFGEVLERDGEVITEEAKKLDKYKESLARIKVEADLAAAKLDAMRTAMTAVNTAAGEEADATKARRMAEIDAAVAGGKMTKAQGDIAKAGIEGASIQEGAARQKSFLAAQDQLNAGAMNVKDFAAIVANQNVAQFEKARGLTGVTDAGPFAALAADDQKRLKAARDQLKELQAEAEGVGVLHPIGNVKALVHQPMLEDLKKAIDKLEAVAAASAERAGDAARLVEMRKAAQEASDTAATARAAFGGSHAAFGTQRSSIDRVAAERLRALGLTTGVTVAGDVQAQAAAESQRAEQFLKTGIMPSTAPLVGRITAAINNLNGDWTAQLQQLLAAIEQLRGQVSRRELQ